MYYKVINQESAVYKELRALREIELRMEKENKEAIANKIPYKWNNYFGHPGQQNWNRTTDYLGFVFENPSEVCLKTWKEHKEHPGTYIPNTRTKAGREMRNFLRNLKGHRYDLIFDIVGVEKAFGTFTFPYLDICEDTLLLYLDKNQEPGDENLIEITKKEFESILKPSKN